MDGDRVPTPRLEDGVGIGLSRAAHVAPLGVDDDRPILRQDRQRLAEEPARLPPPSLVEGEVQLVGRCCATDRFHHLGDEACDALGRSINRPREEIGLGVQPEAKK